MNVLFLVADNEHLSHEIYKYRRAHNLKMKIAHAHELRTQINTQQLHMHKENELAVSPSPNSSRPYTKYAKWSYIEKLHQNCVMQN